jgi:hypothetical protein
MIIIHALNDALSQGTSPDFSAHRRHPACRACSKPAEHPAMSRALTKEETRILAMIQSHFGPQNTAERITWVRGDEATLWVTDGSGAIVVMAHLTNLARWRIDGTIAGDAELKDWLMLEDP